MGTASAQTGDTRTVTVSKDTGLADGENITVSWSGFSPGPAYLQQCRRDSTEWRTCAEFTRLPVVTGPDGTGTAAFTARSGVVPYPQFLRGANTPLSCYGGTTSSACDLIVTECEFDLAAVRTARVALDFVAPFPGLPEPPTAP
ncbi:MAG: neocarzinostatin apoprotein domain-containing protein, partial [Nocardioidaceae bacterium]